MIIFSVLIAHLYIFFGEMSFAHFQIVCVFGGRCFWMCVGVSCRSSLNSDINLLPDISFTNIFSHFVNSFHSLVISCSYVFYILCYLNELFLFHFLIQSSWRFLKLIIFLKHPVLGFTDFFPIIFLVSISFISALIFLFPSFY